MMQLFSIESQIGSKLLIFQNTLPSLGVGCLRLHTDDPRTYGMDKEHALGLPQDPFYEQMAVDFKKHNCTVDVYAFSDKYADIASLSTLAKYTGGQVYYYPNFQSTCHIEKLKDELIRSLTRETAWKVVMHARCGRGAYLTTFEGNKMLEDIDVIPLANVACNQTYGLQLHVKEILPMQNLYFQVAFQYFSSTGERRIRVHNAAVPVVTDVGEMYYCADMGAIVYLFCKLAIENFFPHKLEEARVFIQQQIVKALLEFQNLVAVQHRLGGRMIYPESLKYLPLYGLALCKSIPLRGGYGDAQLDEHCAAGNTILALPIKRLLKLLYPNLFRIDEYLLNVDDFNKICKSLPLSEESLGTKGLYIYNDGFRFIIWFGRMLLPNIAYNLLGEEYATDYSKVSLYERDNEMSRKLMSTLGKLREDDPSYYQLPQLVRHLTSCKPLEDQFGTLIWISCWFFSSFGQSNFHPPGTVTDYPWSPSCVEMNSHILGKKLSNTVIAVKIILCKGAGYFLVPNGIKIAITASSVFCLC